EPGVDAHGVDLGHELGGGAVGRAPQQVEHWIGRVEQGRRRHRGGGGRGRRRGVLEGGLGRDRRDAGGPGRAGEALVAVGEPAAVEGAGGPAGGRGAGDVAGGPQADGGRRRGGGAGPGEAGEDGAPGPAAGRRVVTRGARGGAGRRAVGARAVVGQLRPPSNLSAARAAQSRAGARGGAATPRGAFAR